MDRTSKLYPRSLTRALTDALADTPVVCILGPRQCGKTTFVQSLAPDRPYVNLDEENYFRTATGDPIGFVDSLPASVTIDEVQRVPELFRSIKQSVDRDRRPGRFLLTGSSNLLFLPRMAESLAGRMETILLQPLTESEKERNDGMFLRAFLSGDLAPAISGVHEGKGVSLPARLIAGGFPEPLTRSTLRARQWHRQYLKSILERDIKDVAQVRDVEGVTRFIEMLATRTGELLNVSGLAQDIGLHRETIEHYLAVLERLFLVRRLQAWHRNAARRMIKAPKVHVVDNGLAATLSGLSETDWIEQRDRMGHLLESFVVQQVIAQAAWTEPDMHFWHYRDKDQEEVDLVATLGTKVWGIEVKASTSFGPSDCRGLARLANLAGKTFQAGILLYTGQDILRIPHTPFLAVPIRKLWEL